MKAILDTHTFLWAIAEEGKLSQRASLGEVTGACRGGRLLMAQRRVRVLRLAADVVVLGHHLA